MTIGRWLYALGIMLCVFRIESIAASEWAAAGRDAVFLLAITLIWRQGDASRLPYCGALALVAGWLGMATNGTPAAAIMSLVGAMMMLGGLRLRGAMSTG